MLIYQLKMLNNKTTILILQSILIATAILAIIFFWVYSNNQQGEAIILPYTNYPKIAAFYLATPINESIAKEIARYDLAILNMAAQNNPEHLKKIKEFNPKIILLAYTSNVETLNSLLYDNEPSGNGIWHELNSGIREEWIIKKYTGEKVHLWKDNNLMNHYVKSWDGKRYGDYLIDFLYEKVLKTGYWDGLFFDTTSQNIAWLSPDIDINNDGNKDNEVIINQLWQEGHRYFFNKLREKIGNSYLIVTNGDLEIFDYANGRMFEGFPEYWEGGWSNQMKKYYSLGETGYWPRLNIINSDTENTGNKYDFQSMRFGLTSALLGDGYYNFESGTESRITLWWYDEYSVDLGQPTERAFNIFNHNDYNFKEGVWQRDFERGIVLVNSTNKPQTINLEAEYEKIHGTQDISVNDGSIINRITIPSKDGIILLRPISQIENASFINGSFARIFDINGKIKRNGFFTYDKNYSGNSKIIKQDINRDGKIEILVAGNNSVTLYDTNGLVINTIKPFGDKFQGGISIAVANLEGSGQYSILVSPERGGSNLIKIYNNQLFDTGKQFSAYRASATNLGVQVAAGDVDGDGRDEIITGAGFGGGPHVKIFDQEGNLKKEFFAYGFNFRGGVNVAAGDVDGDGRDEIITGAGITGGPHIKIFNSANQIINQWFAYDSTKRFGVKITASDIDGDGLDEIIALNTNIFMANGK